MQFMFSIRFLSMNISFKFWFVCILFHFQEKITKFYDRLIREGLDLNAAIQKRKDFRNPR